MRAMRRTTVAVELHPREIVAEQLRVRIVAVVVGAPARLVPRRPPRERRAASSLLLPVVALVLLVKLLVDLLLEVREPRVDLALRLDEALAQALLDDGQVVVEEAVLAVVRVVLRPQARLLPAAAGRVLAAI
jgi:hypothetical protein